MSRPSLHAGASCQAANTGRENTDGKCEADLIQKESGKDKGRKLKTDTVLTVMAGRSRRAEGSSSAPTKSHLSAQMLARNHLPPHVAAGQEQRLSGHRALLAEVITVP